MDYFYLEFDDGARKIVLDTLSWLKTIRYSNQSEKDNRIMRTQCTSVINHIRSGSDQYTPKKLEMILTALRMAHSAFQSDTDAYRAFSREFHISESQHAYIQLLSAVYRHIVIYLHSRGFDTPQSEL